MSLSTLTPRQMAASLIGRPLRESLLCILAVNAMIALLAVAVGRPLGDLKREPFGPWTVAHALFSAEILCTAASFLQLLVTAHVLRHVYRQRRAQLSNASNKSGSWRLWLLMYLGFVFLAIDEIAFLHEGLDKLIHWLLAIPESRITDRLDDVIPVFYAAVGMGVLIGFRKEIMRFRTLWPLLCVGFMLFFAMVGLDLLTNRKDVLMWWFADWQRASVWWSRLTAAEESCKLLAEASFLAMFLVCANRIAALEPSVQYREPEIGTSLQHQSVAWGR